MNTSPLRVFLVDDDPTTRMTLGFQLTDPAYEFVELASGDACLAAIGMNPDIILLDVEMPGMDGIAACRHLRDTGNMDTHVIFVSAHDDLETRLRAYEAGGNDYIVKPYALPELKHKLDVARTTLDKQKGLSLQSTQAQHTAFTAISAMGELGVLLQFLQRSFACTSQQQLADEVFSALEQFGLEGILGIRCQTGGTLAMASKRECTPLERSILAHCLQMGRLFQFRNRFVVNADCLTMVVSRLPVDDPDRTGRLRDHLAVLADGASARISAMLAEHERQAQAQCISQTADELSAILMQAESGQGVNRVAIMDAMDGFVTELERAYVHLGLSHGQEERLSDMARRTADKVSGLASGSRHLSEQLGGVIARLQTMSHAA